MWLWLMGGQKTKTFRSEMSDGQLDIQEADSFGNLFHKDLNYVTHPHM